MGWLSEQRPPRSIYLSFMSGFGKNGKRVKTPEGYPLTSTYVHMNMHTQKRIKYFFKRD